MRRRELLGVGPSNTSTFVSYRCSTSRQSSYVSGKRKWVSIANTRAFGSARKSMSSRTDSSFWKEQASETRSPKRSTIAVDELLGGERLGARRQRGDARRERRSLIGRKPTRLHNTS